MVEGTMKRILCGAVLCTLFLTAAPVWAGEIVWDFGAPGNNTCGSGTHCNQALPGSGPPTVPGASATEYNLTVNGQTLEAYAYSYNPANGTWGLTDLYWKNQGTDEHGLGLVSTGSGNGDYELTLQNSTGNGGLAANYMVIDTGAINSTWFNPEIRVQSVTGPEEWNLYGLTAAQVGTAPSTWTASQLILKDQGASTDNTFVSIPLADWQQYQYLVLTVTPNSGAGNNVLFDAIEANPSPEPGTFAMLGIGALLVLVSRKKLTGSRG